MIQVFRAKAVSEITSMQSLNHSIVFIFGEMRSHAGPSEGIGVSLWPKQRCFNREGGASLVGCPISQVDWETGWVG